MKKKLLNVIALFIAITSASHVVAQTDVTDQYLINPSFEILKASDGNTDVPVKENLTNGLYGWELPYLGDQYVNYNLESFESGSNSGFVQGQSISPTEGSYYYFNRRGWGNIDSELKTTTSKSLEPGIYYVTIDYKAAEYANTTNNPATGSTIGITVTDSYSNILGTNNAAQRSFSQIKNGGDPTEDFLASRPWDTIGAIFAVNETSAVTISILQKMKGANGRSDIIYDNMHLYKYDNTSSIDVSGLIANANDYLLAGWSIEGGNTFHVNTWSTEGDSDGSNMKTPFIENWVSSGYLLNDAIISQKLSGLIPGKYKATVLVRTLKEKSEIQPEGASLYLNAASKDVCNGTPISNGTYGTYELEGNVMEDGILDLGFKISGANFNWLAFKDFKLEYIGELEGEIYELGTLSISHNPGTYFIDEINQIVLSYPNAGNNQGAEIALSDDANITINGEKVTASLNENKELVIPVVTTNDISTYTITVPAGVYGYLGHATNEKIELTYEITKRLFNETTCYLSTNVNGKNVYLSRGSSYGTRAISDNYGIAVICSATDKNDISNIKFKDGQKYLFASMSTEVFTDRANPYNWQFEATEGGYKIKEADHDYGYLTIAEDGTLTMNQDAATIWKMLSKEEYDILHDSDMQGQKLSALQSAGFIEQDLENAKAISVFEDKTGTFSESYQTPQAGSDGKAVTIYSHELTGLENGLYRVSMQAFQRTASNATTIPLYLEGYNDVTAYMYAGNEKVQLKSVVDGIQTSSIGNGKEHSFENKGITYYIPNDVTSGQAYCNNNLYNNELYVYVSDGTLNIGIANQSWLGWNANWTGYQNIKVEKIEKQEITITVPVSKAGWATMILPFATQIPNGMTVYTCNNIKDNTLELVKVNEITANVPYIIKSEQNDYSFTGISTASQDIYTSNYLTGTYISTKAPAGSYVLQNQPEADGVAFYRVEESKEPTINSYRAYLTVPAEAGINSLVLQLPDDNVTGIETAMEADNEVDVYSISGVLIRSKVKKSEALNGLDKGIYIVNGIKQAVK